MVGVVRGLGHLEDAATLSLGAMPQDLDRFRKLTTAGPWLEPGFAAVAGLFGVRPLRGGRDLNLANGAVDLGIPIAIASMSARYVANVIEEGYWLQDAATLEDGESHVGGRSAEAA